MDIQQQEDKTVTRLSEYHEIRQIILDAIRPLQDQLDRIHQALSSEFVRKEAIEPRILELQRDLAEAQEQLKDLREQILSTPQRAIVMLASITSLILSLLSLLHLLK